MKNRKAILRMTGVGICVLLQMGAFAYQKDSTFDAKKKEEWYKKSEKSLLKTDTLLAKSQKSLLKIDSSRQPRVEFESLFTVVKTDVKNNPLQYQINDKAISFIQTYMDKQGPELIKMKSWAKPYFNLYDLILESRGIPTQLKYLSVIESHLSSNVISLAGAVGPWQIMPDEAQRLGLKLMPVDERTDYQKSTLAAATILKELYDEFGDWLLVVAAYNGGAGRLRQVIQKMKSKDFWEIQYSLPLETRDHVKKFIATNYVFETDQIQATQTKILPDKKGYTSPEAIANLSKLMIKGRYSAAVIAEWVRIPLNILLQLNPQMEKTLATGKTFELRLPKDKLDFFEAHKNEILQASIKALYQIKD
ncbi:MAG: lytic transglycosylase domain-containing protein [Chitinophagaceae bacterium]|nr:MAG: lytic transglycosylase domain-containing protein [Chitinophagaceae bacterium]